eukprot:SAG31_NODE_86_length_26973_cov_16.850897_33_plen_41_part_00
MENGMVIICLAAYCQGAEEIFELTVSGEGIRASFWSFGRK